LSAPRHHYLVRSVDPIEPPLQLPHTSYVTGRGPFTEAGDRELLREFGADVIISKNSGGQATYSKIAAARALGLEVIMVRRPELPRVASAETVEDVIGWLDHQLAPSPDRGV
jgi:precorrin-6A/cobalt-precorrin-6A reductase